MKPNASSVIVMTGSLSVSDPIYHADTEITARAWTLKVDGHDGWDHVDSSSALLIIPADEEMKIINSLGTHTVVVCQGMT